MKVTLNTSLRCLMSELALNGMNLPGPDMLESIRDAGYEGIQVDEQISPETASECRRLGLSVAGSARINLPAEADLVTAAMADSGFTCATLHLGWGTEDDASGGALIEAVLRASSKYRFPLYIETHRATLFQDIWRTVQFLDRYPEIRVNGDFSHWYTGLELVYGGFENKMRFLDPVFDRVRFLHGRIGNPGCMQVDIGDGTTEGRPFVAHFRYMWTRSMRGFLANASLGDSLFFVPELLASDIYYAQDEKSNRWQQSLVLCRIARECFSDALRSMTSAPGA